MPDEEKMAMTGLQSPDGERLAAPAESRRQPRTPLAGTALHAWGTWLSEFDWSHFATFTTDSATPFSASALERAANAYVAKIDSLIAPAAVSWFRAVENDPSERGHVHMLLHGTDALRIVDLRRLWRHGHADVVRFDPSRGAAWYTSKKIRKGDFYDVSSTMPPALHQVAEGAQRAAMLKTRGHSPVKRGPIHATVVVARDDTVNLTAWADDVAEILLARAGFPTRQAA